MISPYLRKPLRSLQQVQRERAERPSDPAGRALEASRPSVRFEAAAERLARLSLNERPAPTRTSGADAAGLDSEPSRRAA